ncbi:GNAT family N-acetyltransferase [Candidatus Woesearchaeota archaeon]|nr:GNAT family N-acetyltransferase [Candidatus Woesearchaeota archaeon]
MQKKVIVKEATFDDVVKVNKTILEFDTSYNKEYFKERCGDKKRLIIVSYLQVHIKELPIGYIVAYDRFGKGSFYCWMAAVDPKYRGKGALKAMIKYLETWAKKKGYRQLRIKTRNRRREMLNYLVKYGYNFVDVIKKEDILENRILLQKEI